MTGVSFVVATPLFLLAVACQGEIAGEPGSPSLGSGDTTSPAAAGPPTAGTPRGAGSSTATANPMPEVPQPPRPDADAAARETALLRLPMSVYREAITALLQPLPAVKFDPGKLSSLLASAPRDGAGASGYYDPGAPSTPLVRLYLEVAEQLTAPLLTATAFPCSTEMGDQETACVDTFVATTGRRAFRRPLTADEVAAFRAQYLAARTAADRPSAIATLLRTFATSPHFLFAIEGLRSGSTADVVPLDGWEIATRLAILLWDSVPDEVLLGEAGKGALDTPEGVEAAARRMLVHRRAASGLGNFAAQWMHFDGEEAAVREGRAEATLLLEDVVIKGDGRLASVLNAKYSFVNAALATTYGLPRPAGSGFVRADLPAERIGILTLAGVLRGNGSATASPIKRGKMIRENVFCQEVPPPPPDVPPLDEAKNPANSSLRARLAAHRSNPGCAGCHGLIDPIGFAFENFDPNAKYVTATGADRVPVDARGELTGTDVDGSFTGAAALVERLTKSAQVKDCAARQLFRMALGRREDGYDETPLAKLRGSFVQGDGNVRELILAIVSSDAFRTRRNRDIAR